MVLTLKLGEYVPNQWKRSFNLFANTVIPRNTKSVKLLVPLQSMVSGMSPLGTKNIQNIEEYLIIIYEK